MKSNPLDRATLGDITEWAKRNWHMLIVIGGLFGYNVTRPEPELPPVVKAPDVAFTAVEFSQLIAGMQTACTTEVNKWRKRK